MNLSTRVLILMILTAMSANPIIGQDFDDFIAVDSGLIALMNAKTIDGTGDQSKLGQTVLIDGDKIIAVGPDIAIPDRAVKIDLSGHTIIPGLIGLHNHSFYTGGRGRSAQLSFSGSRLYLGSGVTTIRTTGARAPYEELNLKDQIESGQAIGPTMYTTGPYITGEQGSQTMARLSDAGQARRLVDYWSKEGVSWFKAYTWISREELGAVIDEAHKNGKKVTAHLCSVGYREAVALGIDNLEHGLFANSEYAPSKSPDECPPGFSGAYGDLDINSEAVQSTFKDMIDNGVSMTSTLVVYEISVAGRPPIHERVYDILAPEIASEVREIAVARRAGQGSINPKVFAKAMQYEKAFVEAGGLLAAGVDPTGYGAAPPGFGDQRNYELLLEAGFSHPEVVQIMSANGAKVLGIQDEVGTIQPGKTADLVVLEGDLEEIGNLHTTKFVFKQGVGWDSHKLIESVRGIVGIR